MMQALLFEYGFELDLSVLFTYVLSVQFLHRNIIRLEFNNSIAILEGFVYFTGV